MANITEDISSISVSRKETESSNTETYSNPTVNAGESKSFTLHQTPVNGKDIVVSFKYILPTTSRDRSYTFTAGTSETKETSYYTVSYNGSDAVTITCADETTAGAAFSVELSSIQYTVMSYSTNSESYILKNDPKTGTTITTKVTYSTTTPLTYTFTVGTTKTATISGSNVIQYDGNKTFTFVHDAATISPINGVSIEYESDSSGGDSDGQTTHNLGTITLNAGHSATFIMDNTVSSGDTINFWFTYGSTTERAFKFTAGTNATKTTGTNGVSVTYDGNKTFVITVSSSATGTFTGKRVTIESSGGDEGGGGSDPITSGDVYGFRANKTKAVVYSKDDVDSLLAAKANKADINNIVVIKGTETNVPGSSNWPVNVLKADLASKYGITDISEWAVISLMTKGGVSGNNLSTKTIRTNTVDNYPYAYFDSTGYLRIYLYNNNDSAATIEYRIVLMKVS